MLHKDTEGDLIQDVIHGGLSGTITTFAIISGITGAALGATVILIIGLANVFAHALTLGISHYIAAEAKKKYTIEERKRVSKDLLSHLNQSEEELEKFYMKHHFTKSEANKIVETLAKHKKMFAETIMDEEFHIEPVHTATIKTSLYLFFSFLFFGIVPLFSYILEISPITFAFDSFVVAAALTGVTIFGLGSFKAAMTDKRWFFGSMQVLILGGFAAFVAFYVGAKLSHFI